MAFGQVAQLVEHRTENPGVGGSIPPLSIVAWARAFCFSGKFGPFVLAAEPDKETSRGGDKETRPYGFRRLISFC
jgi:hypothetical protein